MGGSIRIYAVNNVQYIYVPDKTNDGLEDSDCYYLDTEDGIQIIETEQSKRTHIELDDKYDIYEFDDFLEKVYSLSKKAGGHRILDFTNKNYMIVYYKNGKEYYEDFLTIQDYIDTSNYEWDYETYKQWFKTLKNHFKLCMNHGVFIFISS